MRKKSSSVLVRVCAVSTHYSVARENPICSCVCVCVCVSLPCEIKSIEWDHNRHHEKKNETKKRENNKKRNVYLCVSFLFCVKSKKKNPFREEEAKKKNTKQVKIMLKKRGTNGKKMN